MRRARRLGKGRWERNRPSRSPAGGGELTCYHHGLRVPAKTVLQKESERGVAIRHKHILLVGLLSWKESGEE